MTHRHTTRLVRTQDGRPMALVCDCGFRLRHAEYRGVRR